MPHTSIFVHPIVEDIIVPPDQTIILAKPLAHGEEEQLARLARDHRIAIAVPHAKGCTVLNAKQQGASIIRRAIELGLPVTHGSGSSGYEIRIAFDAAQQDLARKGADIADARYRRAGRPDLQRQTAFAREFLRSMHG